MFAIRDDEYPWGLSELLARTKACGFDMPSDARTGMLLQMLVASKPGGRFLELGTGTGLATAWLLAGMNAGAHLISVDNDERVQAVAREILGADGRVEFVLSDGIEFLRRSPAKSFDLVFADAWPGKYEARDLALGLVRAGGFYIGDDMLPQPNWPDGHQPRVDELVSQLRYSPDWAVVAPAWGSGFIVAVRRP
jgi:predicted O-methyltransferase YrrM